MAEAIQFSIIVPTFNRAASLDRLLASFSALGHLAQIRAEVIVVNNGSTDGTAEICAARKAAAQGLDICLLDEAKQGKASALNRGLAAARGQFIMVLDDDVVADAELLKAHLDCYGAGGFAAVQGRILPGIDGAGRGADPARLREYNIPLIDYGDRICQIRGLTGTNMSFKRAVFETVGGFDPRLGPGASGFSEDTEFSRRVRNAGFTIGYTPKAVVFHELDPARYGRAYNRMVEYRKGVSRSIYRRDSMVRRILPNLLMNCLRYGFYRALGRSQKAYKTEGRIMKCWGQAVGAVQARGKAKAPA